MADSKKHLSANRIASLYVRKKMRREAFNRYNAPEVLAALFVALEYAGLKDTVNTLKQKGIPKLVNEAWMKRKKG